MDRFVPIEEVRVDADGDYVPDRMGERLMISGRATTDDDAFFTRTQYFFVQDATAGINIWTNKKDIEIASGDSIHLIGTVNQYNGLTQLDLEEFEVVEEAPTRLPEPKLVTVDEVLSEQFEGSLVQFKGNVINRGANESGRYLIVNQPSKSEGQVMVYFSNRQLEKVQMDAFAIGDQIEVTGIVGQYDYNPPYDGYYQVYIPTEASIVHTSIPRRMYWYGAVIGAFLTLVSLAWIVTLRHQVKRRTRELENRDRHVRTVVEHAPVVLLAIDGEGTVTNAEGLALETLGLDADEVSGQPLGDLLGGHPEAEEAIGAVRTGATRGWTSQWEGRFFEVYGGPLNAQPAGAASAIAVAIDITENVEHQRELVAAKEKAEEMDRLKTAFLANMSHEIRTPLTAILGYSQILVEEVEGADRELAETIMLSGERLMETLNGVMDLARLESETLALTSTQVNMARCMSDIEELFSARAVAQGIGFAAEVPDEPVWAIADPAACERIFNHLVSNAIKFTDDGSVTIRVYDNDGWATVEVEDTGVGIDPGFIPHLFDEFKQESEGQTRQFGGNGLGLTIVKRLVDLLGGEIEVRSEKGEGSLFVVRLPKREQEKVEAPAEKVAALYG